MGLKAKKEFSDKETGKVYKEGDPIKVSKEREKQILKSPYNVAEKVEKEDIKEDKTSAEI